MSKNWVQDIKDMNEKFGVIEWVKNNPEKLKTLIGFRMKMIKEEYDETMEAVANKDPEEVVDGLIDLCVFAIQTLEMYGVDTHKAWNAIFEANMAKNPGVKETRPNPLGLPDLIKPQGWQPPSHQGNHGKLDLIKK